MNTLRINTLGIIALLMLMSGCSPSSNLTSESLKVEPHPDNMPVPTLLATRGELMREDDCSEGHRRGLGIWGLSPDEPNVARVTHDVDRKPSHIPTAAYNGLPEHENLIVEVTFRWGEPMGGKYNDQFLGIVSDLRPNKVRGHKIESWISGSGRFTEAGLAFSSSISPGALMDEQPFVVQANTWHTAVLEVVGNEALLRFGDRVAYVDLPRIAGPKNKIALFFGTTWHEIKSVRIWHATANPEWEGMKERVLASREAFTPTSFSYSD